MNETKAPEGGKTLGQIACDAFWKGENPIPGLRASVTAEWERAAQAVVAAWIARNPAAVVAGDLVEENRRLRWEMHLAYDIMDWAVEFVMRDGGDETDMKEWLARNAFAKARPQEGGSQ